MPLAPRASLALLCLLVGCQSSSTDEDGGAAGSGGPGPQAGTSAAGHAGTAGAAGQAGKGGSSAAGGTAGASGQGSSGAPAGGSAGASGKAGAGGAPAGGSAGASGTGQAGSGLSGGGQGGSGDAGSGQAGSGDAGSGQAGSGDAGAGQAGSGLSGGGQGGSGDAGAGQAGSGAAGSGAAGMPACGGSGPGANPLIRVNQVGYRPADTKRALFQSAGAAAGASFVVRDASCAVVFEGPVGADQGSWSASFPHVYALDFSSVTAPGTYTIEVTGGASARSPSFQIAEGAALYGPLLDSALFFFKAQRDGADVDPAVLDRKPSHLTDSQAFVYTKPTYSNDELTKPLNQVGKGTVDVAGGWFDAGDYVKFVETTSYVEAMMLVAVRDHAALLGNGGLADFHHEGRRGVEWLLKMWDDSTQTLYYQVGIGNGSGALQINGDHDLWRLPEADDALTVAPGDLNYFVKFRPALRLAAAGSDISPNLAGRLAADFALCSVVYRATDAALADSCLRSGAHVYELAHTTTNPTIVTTAPKDYYPETSWRDDMELGATELYFALAAAGAAAPAGLPHPDPAYYLGEAASWAKAYLSSKENGSDSLNLYDVSALAHYELFRALGQAGGPKLAVSGADLIAGLGSQLETAQAQAQQDPFRLGLDYGGGDAAPHAFGLALSADFYEEISGDAQYHDLGQQQRDWALGANAWGSSFVVGAGSTYPLCLQHQVANLSGAFDGSAPILRGAVVAGPTDPADLTGLAGSLLDGMLACPGKGPDPFMAFSGHGAQYQDDAADWPTVEPAIDYTAPSILLFARQ